MHFFFAGTSLQPSRLLVTDIYKNHFSLKKVPSLIWVVGTIQYAHTSRGNLVWRTERTKLAGLSGAIRSYDSLKTPRPTLACRCAGSRTTWCWTRPTPSGCRAAGTATRSSSPPSAPAWTSATTPASRKTRWAHSSE